MSKHTPGPWEVVEDCLEERDGRTYVVGYDIVSGTQTIVGSEGISGSENDLANACLIAAAPLLLFIAERWAAIDAGSWHQIRHENEKAELLADTRAAIAKATGDQP